MQYQINSTGAVIVADLDFVEMHYPGDFSEVQDESMPSAARILTHLEYMTRFTQDELRAIYATAKSVIDVEIWLDKFKLAANVSLDDLATIEGLQAMESAGLIGAGRAAEILA